MDDKEQEYEVESIVQAQVVSEGRRSKKKLAWKYRVRWKGYGMDEDTWEPVESFEGSEDIIDTFWGRANTGGRDYHNIRTFKAGEEFLPVGPPRRKQQTSKPDVEDSPQVGGSEHDTAVVPSPEKEKRKRGTAASDGSEGRPNKRAREDGPARTPQLSSPPQKVANLIPFPQGSKNRASRPNVSATSTSSPAHSRYKQKHSMRASSIDEIVPASDGEADDTGISVSQTNNAGGETVARLDSAHRRSKSNEAAGSSSQAITSTISIGDEDMSFMDEADPHGDVMVEENAINIPSHRARAANPLVKMVEPPSVPDVEKAIAVKARLLKGNTTPSSSTPGTSQSRLGRSTQASGSKPGPGRSSTGFVPKKTPKNKSSILTVEKGTLKSVKGKYNKPTESRRAKTEAREDSVEEEDESLWGGDVEPNAAVTRVYSQAPTAEELLDLAGLDVRNVEALPDFEEEPPSTLPTDQPTLPPVTTRSSELEQPSQPVTEPDQPQTDQVKSALQQSLDLAKDKLFPAGASDVLNSLSAAWKRSTIFGPLGLGSEAQLTPPISSLESAQSTPFYLNLDSSISIPIALTTTSPSSSINLGMGQGGPAGKFYQPQPALSLLDTLRTGGSSAKVVLDANATDEQQDHFQRFHSRLQSGELFVAMSGVEVFAFCSAGNSLISQRLNLPSSLLGRPEDLLVSRVVIENYSAYADAALHADSRRWSQYISPV